jgi:hypothetical protein
MVRSRFAPIVGAIFLAACNHADGGATKDVRPTDAWVAPPPSASASAAASASLSPNDASTATDPYAELPPIDATDSNLGLGARVAGYSSDDKYLGWEISTCDPCPSEFHFRGPGVPAIDLRYHYDPAADGELPADVAEKKRKAVDDAVDARLRALGIAKVPAGRTLRGPFPYPDLVFHVTTVSSQNGTVALLFGAHVSSEPSDLAVHPIRIDIGPHPMLGSIPKEERARIAKLPPAERAKAQKEWDDQWEMRAPELAYANVTKDGRELGVVAIASGTMWYEAAGSARMETAAFAAQIYEEVGLRHAKAGDPTTAARWLAKAEAAEPTARSAYELAAALARAKDPKAKDALERALGRDPRLKAKLRTDSDFDGVRSEPWFVDFR